MGEQGRGIALPEIKAFQILGSSNEGIPARHGSVGDAMPALLRSMARTRPDNGLGFFPLPSETRTVAGRLPVPPFRYMSRRGGPV